MLYRRNSIAYRLLDTFFRNWWLIALAVIGVCSVVSAAVFLRKPSYVAKVSIRVITANDVNRALGFYVKQAPPAQRNVDHMGDLMQNILPGGFVDRVLQDAQLKKPINLDPEARDPRFIEFRRRVFSNVESRDMFTIGLTWDNADECQRLVKSLKDNYIEDTGLSQQAQAVATTKLLSSEIENVRKRVSQSEQAIVNYKTTHAGKLPDALIAQAAQLETLRGERDMLNVTSQDAPMKKQSIKQRMAQIKPVSVLEQTFTTDPTVQQLRNYQARRSALLIDGWKATSTEGKALDRTIKALQKQIEAKKKADPSDARNVVETKLQQNPEYQKLSEQYAEADMAERTNKARATLLDNKIQTYEARLKALPAEERQIAELTRGDGILKDKLMDLMRRWEQAQTKARIDKVTATSTMVTQTPIFAQSTTSTTKTLAMMIGGLVIGVVVGLLAVVAREWADSSLRYGSDAARLLGVPVLACLPDSPELMFPAPQRRRIAGLLPGSQRQLSSSLGATQP